MAKKSGKYAAVIGKLPTLGIDPSRRDAVTQAQEQIKAPLIDHEPGCAEGDPDAEDLIDDIKRTFAYLVELKKRQTAGKPYAAEYARAYAECRAIREKIVEWDGAFSLLVEAYQWLMIEQMEVEGTRALTLANGQPVHTFEEPQAKVDNAEKFRQWCMASADVCMACGRTDEDPDGYVHQPNDDGTFPDGKHAFHPGGGMTNRMQLPWSSTNALTKEMLLAGQPEPDGVSVWKKTVVRLGAGDE